MLYAVEHNKFQKANKRIIIIIINIYLENKMAKCGHEEWGTYL